MRTLLILLAVVMTLGVSGEEFDHVTYLGQTIPLSRVYADFHDYRDDPNNLPETVRKKVAELVRTAPVAAAYSTRKAIDDALFDLMFPGYGYSMLGLQEPVALYSLEVPCASEDRFILFAPADGVWKLADDFVWPQASGFIERAVREGDVLVYYNKKGAVLRRQSKRSK